MEPKKYRKKPVEIEAVQLTSANIDEVAKWADAEPFHKGELDYDLHAEGILIPTLEGSMIGTPGDYIIRGVQGEFYPCKPEIFEATYDSTSRTVDVTAYGDREPRSIEVSDESIRNRR